MQAVPTECDVVYVGGQRTRQPDNVATLRCVCPYKGDTDNVQRGFCDRRGKGQ